MRANRLILLAVALNIPNFLLVGGCPPPVLRMTTTTSTSTSTRASSMATTTSTFSPSTSMTSSTPSSTTTSQTTTTTPTTTTSITSTNPQTQTTTSTSTSTSTTTTTATSTTTTTTTTTTTPRVGCLPDATATHSSCKTNSSNLMTIFALDKTAIVAKINSFRSSALLDPQPDPALNPVAWDEDLSYTLERWLSQCDYDLDDEGDRMPPAKSGSWLDVNFILYGSTGTTINFANNLDGWFAQRQYWQYAFGLTTSGEQVYAFTQLVRNTTTHVGCAAVRCSSVIGSSTIKILYGCYFGPGGHPYLASSVTTPTRPNQSTTPAKPPAVASSCGHSNYYKPSGGGIVGGVEAAPNLYPWLVRLRIATGTGAGRCGGTIIDERWVLTAAHCFSDDNVASDITVYIGDVTVAISEATQYKPIAEELHIHEDYDPGTEEFDFALIKLPHSLSSNFSYDMTVQKICMPTANDPSCTPGTVAYIAGWGALNYGGDTPNELMSAYVSIVDQSRCELVYPGLTSNMLCAGYESGGVDTCQGDSGGPLMVVEDGFFKLCGVVSYGVGCAYPNTPGVYARVSSNLAWINTITGLSFS